MGGVHPSRVLACVLVLHRTEGTVELYGSKVAYRPQSVHGRGPALCNEPVVEVPLGGHWGRVTRLEARAVDRNPSP